MKNKIPSRQPASEDDTLGKVALLGFALEPNNPIKVMMSFACSGSAIAPLICDQPFKLKLNSGTAVERCRPSS